MKSRDLTSLGFQDLGLYTGTYLLSPVTLFTTLLTILGGRISSFRTLDSVASGNPLSNISSNNYRAKQYFSQLDPYMAIPYSSSSGFLYGLSNSV